MSKPARTGLEKTVPMFANVIQPRFAWEERETEVLQGITSIPKSSEGKKAEISAPTLKTDLPDARAVRIHEMLHARFTPDIQKEASSMVKDGYSNIALQVTEDIRLSYIAKRNEAFPSDAHFTSATLSGVANHLARMVARMGRPELLASNRVHETRAVATAIILSMHGHPVEGVNTFDTKSCIDAIKGHVEGEAFLRVVDLLGGSPQIEEAVSNIFAKARDLYEGHKIGTNRAALKQEREMFREMFAYVHDTLESILFNEPPPPPAPPSQEGDDSQDKGDEDGTGSGSEGQGDDGSQGDAKPEDKPEEPKSEEQKAADAENEKYERELRKASSDQIDRSMAMGTTVSREAIGVIRAAFYARPKPIEPPSSFAPQGGFRVDDTDRPNNPDDVLVQIEDINFSKDVSNVGWAPMEIVRPQLTRAFKVRVPRRGRPSLDGELPRHWSRWFADRAILDSRGRRPGGTLLIDVSGSMSWSHEQTMKLIESVPAATIAAYSGARVSGKGILTILAHQGRVVAEDDPWRAEHGGQNICDGPALAWLIKQASPRVWFSDGQVTVPNSGGGEVGSLDAFIDAQRLLRLGGGWIVANAQAAIDIFHGKQPQEGAARRSIMPAAHINAHGATAPHLRKHAFWFA